VAAHGGAAHAGPAQPAGRPGHGTAQPRLAARAYGGRRDKRMGPAGSSAGRNGSGARAWPESLGQPGLAAAARHGRGGHHRGRVRRLRPGAAGGAGQPPPGYGWPDRTLRPTHKTETLGQFSSLRCFRSLRAFPRRLCLARRIQWPWLCAVPAALAMSAIGYYFAYRRIGHQSAADSSPVSTGAATRQDHRPQPAGRPGVQQHTDRLRRPARPGARTRRAGHRAVSFTHSVSVTPDISPESGDDLSPSRR